MIICNPATPVPADPDRRVRTIAEQALRCAQDDLRENADPVEQIEAHLRTILAAQRPSRRPQFDLVRHVCLAAITLQVTHDLYPHACLFAACSDPCSCRLAEAVRTLLAELDLADRRFNIGMAASRIWIWPLR